jgi:uncharacterized protein YkwD
MPLFEIVAACTSLARTEAAKAVSGSVAPRSGDIGANRKKVKKACSYADDEDKKDKVELLPNPVHFEHHFHSHHRKLHREEGKAAAAWDGKYQPGKKTKPHPVAKKDEKDKRPHWVDKEEFKLIKMINNQRKKHGCGELAISRTLTHTARAHSKHMADDDFFATQAPGGTTPWDRLYNAGYKFTAAAENVAAGPRRAKEVYKLWYVDERENDGANYQNLMNCKLNEIGVGHHEAAHTPFHHYWTADLATGNNKPTLLQRIVSGVKNAVGKGN